MGYKKIHLELIVFADEADAVVTELNTMLDGLEEKHTLFGGEIETAAVKHEGMRKRSALGHTKAAGETAVGAVRNGMSAAVRAVIG
jgi:D-ribose pyranose/furanose isomerase RbsD